MRIGELSRRSDVSIPSIKFYLREGLLPAGVATAANQADYGEAHVQRLQLIRAMIDAGRLSVARTREILAALDSGQLAPHDLLGVAHEAVTRPVRDDRDDPSFRDARAEVEALARERGWLVEPGARAIDQAADAIRTLRALGAEDLLALRDTYADAAQAVAEREVDAVVARRDPARMVEAVVVGTVLGETLFNAFRLLAQESASARILPASDVENRGPGPFSGKAKGIDMHLQGKNAVVYGAAGHMGTAVTTAFAEAGARVFLVGRTRDTLEALAGKIRADGGRAEVAAFDATDQAAVDAHLAEIDHLDVSFNALGLNVIQNVPMIELEYEHFINPIIDAATMHFVTATAAARRMIPQGSGVIIMLTATSSWETRHVMGGFAPANAAVEALTRSLAGEVGRHGVRVVGIRTNLVPATLGITDADVPMMVDDTLLGRLPRLSDVGGTAVYLASDAASALTATTINHSSGAIVN